MRETAEARAVKIAARVMTAAGLCRHEAREECKWPHVDEAVCDRCIRSWLLKKARAELAGEEEPQHEN